MQIPTVKEMHGVKYPMVNIKQKMPSLTKAKLSEVIVSNVATPGAVLIQSAKKSLRYDSNGNPVQGSCSKIVCHVIDLPIVKALEKLGADSSSLKSEVLELRGSEETLLEVDINQIIGSELDVTNADVMLRWEQDKNGSGSWRSLKMVLNLDLEETREEG